MPELEDNDGTLVRRLDGAASVAIVAGSMLGVGIFLNPRLVAEQFASPWAFMAMWVLGGLIALSGAAAYAQLGSMFPRAGGDYVYLREAFGPAVAAAGGWILVVAVFPGSLATMAVALGQYQLPVLLDSVGYVADSSFAGLSVAAWTALALVFALTVVNGLGAHLSGRAQVWMTVTPVAALALMAIYALVFGGDAAVAEVAMPVAATTSERSTFEAFTASYMAVYFAYSGWNAVGYVGGEVGDPARNIPLGLLGGTALVTVLYVMLCGAFVGVMGMDGLRGTMESGSAMARVLFGDRAVIPIAALIAFAIVGSLNATVLAGARITFAMARDGALPSALGHVWSPTSTPARALLLQLMVSCLLIVSGTFEQLLAMTSLAMLVLGILTVSALFVLRARGVAEHVPRFGYPLLPAVYLVFAFIVVGVSVRSGLRGLGEGGGRLDDEFVFSLIGLAVFVVLFGVYLVRDFARSRARQARG